MKEIEIQGFAIVAFLPTGEAHQVLLEEDKLELITKLIYSVSGRHLRLSADELPLKLEVDDEEV